MSIDFSKPAGCPKCKDPRIIKKKETDDRVYWKCYSPYCGKEWQQLKIPFCIEEEEDENDETI